MCSKRITFLAVCVSLFPLLLSGPARAWAEEPPAGSEAHLAGKSAPQSLPESSDTKVLRLIKLSAVARDTQGKPLTGVLGLTLALYEDEEGGAPLWMETQLVEADAQGRYSVLLGATQSEGVPLELFTAGQARWLGVQVQGQKEEPRLLLASVPYALMAAEAGSLSGRSASEFVLAEELRAPGGPEKFGLAAVNAPQPAAAAGGGGGSVKGSGTANYLARWTASDTLANSIIFQTPDGKIGIGTTRPAEQLHIAGDVMADVFFGSGTGLTQLNPANLIPGTAGINITGNAGTASFAANADLLDNLDSTQFARVDSSNIFQADQTMPNLFVGNVTSTGLVSGASVVTSAGSIDNLNVPGLLSGTSARFNGSNDTVVQVTQTGTGVGLGVNGGDTAVVAEGVQTGLWATGSKWGVRGESTDQGVFGLGFGEFGKGVVGVARENATTGAGVYGAASAPTGNTHGIVGAVASPDGTAGRFQNFGGGPILEGVSGETQVFLVEGNGTVRATAFVGDGSGLTNLPVGGGGDITAVYAGTGLTGGGSTGDATLGLDTAFADGRYAQLDASNAFTGDITAANFFANNLTASGALSGASVVASAGSIDDLTVNTYLNVVGPLVGTNGNFLGGPGSDFALAAGGTKDGLWASGSRFGVNAGGPSTSTGVWATGNDSGVGGGALRAGAHGVWGGNGYGGVAINGVSFGGDTGDSIGVFGISNSPNGVGVRGHTTAPGTGTGVHGQALAETGETQGVVGIVNSPQGTAGVFRNYGGGTILRGLTTNEGGEVFRVEGSGDVVTTTGNFLALAPGKGIILRSPNGATCVRLGINDDGTLSLTTITCP